MALGDETPADIIVDLTVLEDDEDTLTPAAVEDERDRKLGRYDLRYQIASGGMASLYLASVRGPAGFEKLVAIKRMHPHLARKREYVEMFLDEARLASKVHHPNVCQVFDFGELDGAYYIAMEYLVGESLGRLGAAAVESGLIATDAYRGVVARVLSDAAEGLHASHELTDERGQPLEIVHRDVSPQNILVTYDGAVKIVDFGVARAVGRLHQTTTGTLKGKFAYMAPELVQGERYDRRADVWGLGVCLWELLTGKRLFRRPSEMQTLQAVTHAPIPSPKELVPDLPDTLCQAAMRALERDPEKRTRTARQLSKDLQRYILERSEIIGMPEVAELMKTELARQRTTKLELLQTAITNSQVVATVSNEATKMLVGALSPANDRGGTSPAMTPAAIALPQPAAGSRRWLAVAGAAAVLVAAAGATAALVLGEPEQPDPIVVVPLPAVPPASRDLDPPAVNGPAPAAPPDMAPEPETAPRAEAATVTMRSKRAARRPREASRNVPRTTESPGTLSIAVRGGRADQIRIDGRVVGAAPYTGDLAAGAHRVELRFSTGAVVRRTVTIEPGQRTPLVVNAP